MTDDDRYHVPELDDPRHRRQLPRVGLWLTGLYLVGLALYLWWQGQDPTDLALNELGDFLGGVSSPLAFLWLVLGFFQQAREMRADREERRQEREG